LDGYARFGPPPPPLPRLSCTRSAVFKPLCVHPSVDISFCLSVFPNLFPRKFPLPVNPGSPPRLIAWAVVVGALSNPGEAMKTSFLFSVAYSLLWVFCPSQFFKFFEEIPVPLPFPSFLTSLLDSYRYTFPFFSEKMERKAFSSPTCAKAGSFPLPSRRRFYGPPPFFF